MDEPHIKLTLSIQESDYLRTIQVCNSANMVVMKRKEQTIWADASYPVRVYWLIRSPRTNI